MKHFHAYPHLWETTPSYFALFRSTDLAFGITRPPACWHLLAEGHLKDMVNWQKSQVRQELLQRNMKSADCIRGIMKIIKGRKCSLRRAELCVQNGISNYEMWSVQHKLKLTLMVSYGTKRHNRHIRWRYCHSDQSQWCPSGLLLPPRVPNHTPTLASKVENQNKWVKVNTSHFTLRNDPSPPLYLNNIKIPPATTVKYLGLHLDTKLNWKDHIIKKRKQMDIRYKELYWLLGRKSNLSIENKLLLYKSIITPVWTYGTEIWGCASKSNIAII